MTPGKKVLKDKKEADILKVAEQSRNSPGADYRALVADVGGTDAYVERMKNLGESEYITNVITFQSRNALWRRNGTEYEDLIFIDPQTGKHKAQRSQDIAGRVEPTEEMKDMVLKNPRKIISLHNHPHSMLPSKADLEQAKRYKYGVIACHDGKIFKYYVADDANIRLADIMLDKIQGRLDAGKDVSADLRLVEEIGVKIEVIT